MRPRTDTEHYQRARRALDGVGDPDHEWVERGNIALHYRRRLSAREVLDTGLVIRDVRGTPEYEQLLAPVSRWLPAGYRE